MFGSSPASTSHTLCTHGFIRYSLSSVKALRWKQDFHRDWYRRGNNFQWSVVRYTSPKRRAGGPASYEVSWIYTNHNTSTVEIDFDFFPRRFSDQSVGHSKIPSIIYYDMEDYAAPKAIGAATTKDIVISEAISEEWFKAEQ